ncbi:LLM class flavin-dependent oxidoreductase [Microbacterium sp. NPDC076895]|uniref:LLM class flavin-dependent oxidoreductase n=1 Tax=Microbacterium sp. NPDC076895 TaxID=3154957 RepID=UPI003449D7E1
MRSLGVVFEPAFPPERLREVAQSVEDAGVAELWLWEDCFRESGIASAAVALAATTELTVGIGVLPMPLRNVALTAMELATLSRLFPGRIIGGVGHGVQSWMAQVGARRASPLTLMAEYLPTLRALLAGERVTIDGRYVRLDDVALDWPPAIAVPVLAAAEGPKTLDSSGALADGTVIPSGWSPSRVREAVIRVRTAAAEHADEHCVVVYLLTRFTEDSVASDEPAERNRVVGDVSVVADTVEAFFAAGATTVVLQPSADDDDLIGFSQRSGDVARMLGIARSSTGFGSP